MVEKPALPATVEAAKADEALPGNHHASIPTSSWETRHGRNTHPFQRARRNRLEQSASMMDLEANSEDDETTKQKKKKNREAARRCRMRKKEHYEKLKKEKLVLTSRETTMKYKVSQLKKSLKELQQQLRDHLNSPHCKIHNSTKSRPGLSSNTFTIDPTIARGLQNNIHLPPVRTLLPPAHVAVHQPRSSPDGRQTATSVRYDATPGTYCNTLQHSPMTQLQETVTASDDHLPAFSLLMSTDKSAGVMSADESNLVDGKVNEGISGGLLVQATQVLNNQTLGGLSDITQMDRSTQLANNHSMGGWFDNTQITTVSRLENNRETEIISKKSEQTVVPMNVETVDINTDEQTVPCSWIIKTETSSAAVMLGQSPGSIQNPFQFPLGKLDLDQFMDSGSDYFSGNIDSSSEYITLENYSINVPDKSIGLNPPQYLEI